MKTNLRRTMASWMLAVGLMLALSGCLCFPGQTVFFADRALESAVRAALNQPFGFLCERDLEKLHELNAEGIGVVDIRGLEYCTGLTTLNLRSNQIRSISPLAGLRNLTWLDLGDNVITNIEPLSGLYNLEYLSLYGANNDIRDWSPLAANVEAGGLGAGDVVTLGVEWTLNSDSTILPEFAPYYRVLQDANVVVVFAQADGATARR
jgi:hypothetical protein